MPTKKEIYDIEQENTGVIHLYPEGMFYRAYEMSAFLLCALVHPFKVSCHYVKTIGDNLLSVGFPQSSLEKWSSGHHARKAMGGVDILLNTSELDNICAFEQWKDDQVSSFLNDGSGHLSSFSYGSPVSFLQVYGDAYALTLEICRLCANLDRTYRYSLGEELRTNAIKMVLDIDTASKSKDGTESIVSAEKRLYEIQLCLRLLSDLDSIPKKRHVSFIEMTDNISKQLAAWESSRHKETASECRCSEVHRQ